MFMFMFVLVLGLGLGPEPRGFRLALPSLVQALIWKVSHVYAERHLFEHLEVLHYAWYWPLYASQL